MGTVFLTAVVANYSRTQHVAKEFSETLFTSEAAFQGEISVQSRLPLMSGKTSAVMAGAQVVMQEHFCIVFILSLF